MRTTSTARDALRQWLAEKNGAIAQAQLTDDFPIMEQRVITSLQVMDLLLFIEELRGESLDVRDIHPGVFRSIDTICQTFIEGG